ncbi:MAG: hypothetical protein P8Z75_15460 [Gammaproteobacteria bacterium]
MSRNKHTCHSVQRNFAAGCGLNPAQQLHLQHCPHCAQVAQQFQRVDTLVDRASENLVPTGFSERLMAHMPTLPAVEIAGDVPVCDKLLARFSHSRLLRNIAISLGIALGIGQLIQLVLGIFFVSMMAAM